MRAQRRSMQIIFQDPYASLNPRMTVLQTLSEPLLLYGLASGRRKVRRELLGLVGLSTRAIHTSSRAASGSASALPARLRSAPAHRRRAGLRTRRVDPGAGHQPLMDLQQRLELSSVHRPRSRVVTYRHAGGGDVSGPDRGVRGQASFRAPAPSLHAGAAFGDSSAAPGARASGDIAATCRARSTPRRAAASAPAVRTRKRGARRRTRR